MKKCQMEISRRIDILGLLILQEEVTLKESQTQIARFKKELVKYLQLRMDGNDAIKSDSPAGTPQPKQRRQKEPTQA